MELQKHAHPLTRQCLHLINIVNRKVADDTINVPDALMIGEEMKNNFVASLPNGFHSSITGKVKTMENMKKGIRVGEKMVYDMEALYSHLLIVGQAHNISLKTIFEYELCGVPSAIIDEFGLLRKVNKANLVKKFAVTLENPCSPDELIVDASQMLCHTVWASGGTVSTLAENMSAKLHAYKGITTKVIFDRYSSMSVKDLNGHGALVLVK